MLEKRKIFWLVFFGIIVFAPFSFAVSDSTQANFSGCYGGGGYYDVYEATQECQKGALISSGKRGIVSGFLNQFLTIVNGLVFMETWPHQLLISASGTNIGGVVHLTINDTSGSHGINCELDLLCDDDNGDGIADYCYKDGSTYCIFSEDGVCTRYHDYTTYYIIRD